MLIAYNRYIENNNNFYTTFQSGLRISISMDIVDLKFLTQDSKNKKVKVNFLDSSKPHHTIYSLYACHLQLCDTAHCQIIIIR